MKAGNMSFNVDEDHLSTEVQVAFAVLTFGGSAVGFFGNMLVMLAVMSTASMRHRAADILVFNLAITDILICVLPMPVLGSYFVFHWPTWTFGNTTCQAITYIVNVCSMVSVLTLVVIAIDRYFAVVKNRHILRRRVLTVILIVMWIVAAAALTYPLLDGGVAMDTVGGNSYSVCNKMTGSALTDDSFRRSAILKLAVGVIVQVMLMLLYARMGYTLWVWRKLPTAESSAAKSVQQNRKMKLRAFRMMFAIVIAFGVSWMPYWVTTFLRLKMSEDDDEVPPEAVLLTYAIAMLNSSINPILYALLSKKFRRAYIRVLTGCKSKIPSRYMTSKPTRKITISSQNGTNHTSM